jgi:hypothetical protein
MVDPSQVWEKVAGLVFMRQTQKQFEVTYSLTDLNLLTLLTRNSLEERAATDVEMASDYSMQTLNHDRGCNIHHQCILLRRFVSDL